jgi:uncharacterized protein YigE (DUF2233 family)
MPIRYLRRLTVCRLSLVTAMAAFALGHLATSDPARAAQSCEKKTFDGAGYVICSFDAKRSGLRLFWQNGEGRPYRSFSALAAAVEQQGGMLRYAFNAGMYSDDFTPMGLYVEAGRELRKLNKTDVRKGVRPVPNFYKKPNGVFFITADGARILSTDDFAAARPKVRFATQSGPMLVIDGRLHPSLIPGSTDTNIRSGVGVCSGEAVRFAVSETSVNFHDFARLFRDELGCSNALFLDGGGGVGLYAPELGRNDFSWHGGYGPMVGFVE